jgi:putative intracellular protease/amidase
MKILMVVTSHGSLGDTGKPTGLWLEEFATPYFAFLDAGARVIVASPKGGRTPVDPKSDSPSSQTESIRRLKGDEKARAALLDAVPLADVSAKDFDAIFYPGGHGPLWDLVDDPFSIALIEETLAASKPAAFVCHGPAALRGALNPEGHSIVEGKNVTGFSNTEEDEAGLGDIVPFRVEDMLKERGGRYMKEKDWEPHVVMDGMLITGQNPASSEGAAKALLEKLHFFSLKGAVKTIPWLSIP